MKKKIKDLTLEEANRICSKHGHLECSSECPLYRFKTEYRRCGILSIYYHQDRELIKEELEELEEEIEVNENV